MGERGIKCTIHNSLRRCEGFLRQTLLQEAEMLRWVAHAATLVILLRAFSQTALPPNRCARRKHNSRVRGRDGRGLCAAVRGQEGPRGLWHTGRSGQQRSGAGIMERNGR